MSRIIVDTNIVFSALLNSEGNIGNLLFQSKGVFEFFTCQYLRFEIQKHWSKLLKVSKLSSAELSLAYEKVLSEITFINDEIIPQSNWEEAEFLLTGIDLDDINFVALTRFMDGYLWTGDKVLQNGLKIKGFYSVYSTPDLLQLRINS